MSAYNDAARCECGSGLVQEDGAGRRMACASPECPSVLRLPGACLLGLTLPSGAREWYGRRAVRVPGAVLWRWQLEPDSPRLSQVASD